MYITISLKHRIGNFFGQGIVFRGANENGELTEIVQNMLLEINPEFQIGCMRAKAMPKPVSFQREAFIISPGSDEVVIYPDLTKAPSTIKELYADIAVFVHGNPYFQ